MKKIIALVLAVALSLSMASVAFAANDYVVGSDLTGTTAQANPGDKVKIHRNLFTGVKPSGAGDVDKDYLSTDYFSIKVEYERGKDLVKEVKFDGDYVVIEFKDSLAKVPTIANFQIKAITLTGKKDGLDKTVNKFRNQKYKLESTALRTAVKVGYQEVSELIEDDFDVKSTDIGDNLVKFKNKVTISGVEQVGKDYGVATIDFDGKASAEVRVYKNESFFLGTKYDADLDIVKANPDADVEFLTFTGNPTFSANASVEIFADEDTFLYEIKDGKLVKSSLKYDDDAGAFVGKARTLGKYVISDIELVAAATTEETKNPDTGANDVVGVAVALAVVSLVAAGAVSLKK